MERLPPGIRDRTRLIGEEFRLGEFRGARRAVVYGQRPWAGMVIVFASFGVLGGLIAAIISALSPAPGIAVARGAGISLAVSVVSGACIWLVARLILRTGREVGWLHRYSDGFAQLFTGEVEPRVLRWADVTSVTVSYYEPEEGHPRVDGFSASPAVGVEPTFGAGWGRCLRGLAVEAHGVVGARLVPALIEEWESGRPVQVGGAGVGQEGITHLGRFIRWQDMDSISMSYFGGTDLLKSANIEPRRVKGAKGEQMRRCVVRVSGAANGVFLPHVIARAAARNRIEVRHYRELGA